MSETVAASKAAMTPDAKIYVAGHRGLVGGAILKKLEAMGFSNLVTRTHRELDLCNQAQVEAFFKAERPEFVFMAAAKVGGIHANDIYPAEFIRDNLAIQTNVIHSAWANGTKKFEFLGSSCIYPKLAPQPMKEEHLLTGPLETTNEWYAIAKIAGIKTCQAYRKQYGFNAISLMPTNLYGPGDNFDLNNSHVLPALIRKFEQAVSENAPTVTVWGTGTPCREFLYVDDLADAAVYLMQNYDGAEFLNVGTGTDVTIRELAETIAAAVGFKGSLVFDRSKPDGTPRKLMDVSRLAELGWTASTQLNDGIRRTLDWFRATQGDYRAVA